MPCVQGDAMARREGYILEFIAHGRTVKVTAVDPLTGTEASIVGSAQASQDELGTLAVRKLEYVLRKHRNRPDDPTGRGGMMV